jgi:REP-associated tyrosine transposase
MPDWPHSPCHKLTQSGTYIVTAATYEKQPIFHSGPRLDLLLDSLLERCVQYQWKLEAWAVFPNHYHFVAGTAHPERLRKLLQELHSVTARAVNALDGQPGRRVWFQYWDTQITNQRSYLARLHYVHENAVRHGVAKRSANYPWCSASWFERRADPAFRKTVLGFPCDRVSVPDAFELATMQL